MILRLESNSSDLIRQMSVVLGQAFLADPFYIYVMPNERSRQTQVDWWMSCMTCYGSEYGRVYTTPEPITGVAIWLGPDNPMIDVMGMARKGLIEAPFRLGIRGLVRMLEVSNQWEHLHKQEALQHWYLMFLGVLPETQGRGVGSSLLQPVLEEADQEGVPCYLETMRRRNVEFYRKHGFQVVVEGQVGAGIPYWTMRRSPQLQ